MSTGYQNILLEWRDATAWVTLNRPDKLNPLDWATLRELNRALDEINARPDIVSAVITGAGRAFSAGGDLEGYVGLYKKPDAFGEFLRDFHRLLTGMEASQKVFIAAINGVCVAGGLELLLACDLVYAADTAKIGDGHVNFGQLPGAGGSQRLPRVVGPLKAKQLIFTGELVSAEECKRIGLVNDVIPAAELENVVLALATGFADKSRVGLRTAKHLVNTAMNTDFANGLEHELSVVHRYATTEFDATEGLVAFAEKRKPKFSR
jgi:enoyl-CoA hydratase